MVFYIGKMQIIEVLFLFISKMFDNNVLPIEVKSGKDYGQKRKYISLI